MLSGQSFILEIARQGNFTHAAQNLYMTQPALSAAVKKLEKKLGFAIFDRSQQPILPTPEGKIYIQALEELERLEERTRDRLNGLRQLHYGSFTAGGSILFTSAFMPRLFRHYHSRYPRVGLHIKEGNTAQLTEQLLAGEIDILLDNCHLAHQQLQSIILAEERLYLALPEPYASSIRGGLSQQQLLGGQQAPPLKLKRLGNIPLIALQRGNDTATRLEKLCRYEQYRPNIILEPEQLMTAYNMALCGLGGTIVSDLMVRALHYHTGLKYYPLEGAEAKRQVRIYYRQHNSNPAVQAFLDLVEEKTVLADFASCEL